MPPRTDAALVTQELFSAIRSLRLLRNPFEFLVEQQQRAKKKRPIFPLLKKKNKKKQTKKTDSGACGLPL